VIALGGGKQGVVHARAPTYPKKIWDVTNGGKPETLPRMPTPRLLLMLDAWKEYGRAQVLGGSLTYQRHKRAHDCHGGESGCFKQGGRG
jgi:hypothetical protein